MTVFNKNDSLGSQSEKEIVQYLDNISSSNVGNILDDLADARRYHKLRALMSVHNEVAWNSVCCLSVIGRSQDDEDFDEYLDKIVL